MPQPEQSNSRWLVQSHVLDVIGVKSEWTRNHTVINGYLSVSMTHEGITHEAKVQFPLCFTETLTLWFCVAEVYPFMSSSWSHTVETIATPSGVLLLKPIGIAPNKWHLKKATARTHTDTHVRTLGSADLSGTPHITRRDRDTVCRQRR